MDNLRAVIKNLFCYISPQEILRENTTYDNINKDTFVKLGNSYINKYNSDEIHNMYDYLENEFKWQNRKIKNVQSQQMDFKTKRAQQQTDLKMNVFDALTTFNYSVLVEENGYPLCQYQNLLRWREMITAIEEDIFNTSFLAMQDVLSGRKRVDFFWKPVIGHNNYALNKLVSRGVAENHFHLKGSAPQFHLSWISLMNNIANIEFEKVLKTYDHNKLQRNINYNVEYNQYSLVAMWRQAALIRLFLFSVLIDENLIFENVFITYEQWLECCSNDDDREFIRKKQGDNNSKELVDVKSYFKDISEDSIHNIQLKYAEKKIKQLLEDYELLDENILWVQENIDIILALKGKSEYDYTLYKPWLVNNPRNGLNEIISGERWFMYSIFKKIYSKDKKWEKYANWFYLYLVLKTNIRMELVQANRSVGFSNFQDYQNRKEQLIENTIYEKAYIKMAVRDTIMNQHIVSLEARVSPKDNAYEMKKAINKYDSAICEGLSDSEAKNLKEKYFFVVHFIKDKEEYQKDLCRHYYKRSKLKQQAMAIADIRQEGNLEGERIHGIDACSAEIGCRPEVFAHTFRYLKNYSSTQCFQNGIISEGFIENKNIMATYHVGEDFLDLLDGLRAIDEAIVFLNLKCGDRLGHALALGVDIDDWYNSKSNRILISKQDYLDNIVWLHSRIRKYNIEDCKDAEIYIEKRFSEYFNDIYRGNINKYLKEYGNNENYNQNYFNSNVSTGINEYYDSWKLRGDDPELYRTGEFAPPLMQLDEWDYYAINRTYPLNYTIRYNPEVAFLYYMYHYDWDVINTGKQMIEVKVKPCIIDTIKKVRKEMQKEIARMGLGIETNPSSNYHIGTFRRYDKHPIVDWYNKGLVYDNTLIKECPQLQVSINTDDQGVFATYIENEYAYMALALEKSKDNDGEFVYNRTDILQWLDNIRKMGIDQSFNTNDFL